MKYLQVFNLVANILLTLVLVFMFFGKNEKIDFVSSSETYKKWQASQSNTVTNIPSGGELQKFTNNFGIRVNDEGYIDNDITANLAISKEISITVANEGAKNHSFIVDSLGIDSGSIEPGQSKKIKITNAPDRTVSYSFYSDVPDDYGENFRGKMLVVKSEN